MTDAREMSEEHWKQMSEWAEEGDFDLKNASMMRGEAARRAGHEALKTAAGFVANGDRATVPASRKDVDQWNQCHVCGSTADEAVGVLVSGDVADGSYAIQVVTMAACNRHSHQVGTQAVAERWGEFTGALTAKVKPGIALKDREEWLIEEALRMSPEDGPTRAELEAARDEEPSLFAEIQFQFADD